jgi:hypothetical protein
VGNEKWKGIRIEAERQKWSEVLKILNFVWAMGIYFLLWRFNNVLAMEVITS